VSCALGPYNFQFMTEVTKEIVSKYKVDGVFSNRWAGSGQCFCDSCQRISKPSAGSICQRQPIRRTRAAPVCRLASEAALRTLAAWDAEIKKINHHRVRKQAMID